MPFFLRCCFIALVMACTACAGKFHVDNSQPLPLADEHFVGFEDVDITSQEEIFGLDARILEAVARHVRPGDSEETRFTRVITHVMGDPVKDYHYQAGANHTATDAYYLGNANCMSLSILGYALAKAADTNVQLQQVHTPAYWQDKNGYVVNTSHINLKFEPKVDWRPKFTIINDEPVMLNTAPDQPSFELDFFPEMVEQDFKRTVLSEQEVTAMFYSNVASELMMGGKTVEAYAYFKAAIETAPRYAGTWVNLGVLYRRQGLDALALRSYQQALRYDSRHVSALNNMITLAGMLEQVSLAAADIDVKKLQRRLDRLRQRNAYYHQFLAARAFKAGDYAAAIEKYKKAMRLKSREHQFHYGIAKAYIANDQSDLAQKHMEKALDLAYFDDDIERYEGKLAFLERLAN